MTKKKVENPKCNKCNNKSLLYVNYRGKKLLLCYNCYDKFYTSVPEGVLDWGMIGQGNKSEPIIAPHRVKSKKKQDKQKKW